MTSHLIALLASAGLIGAGVASATETRAFQAMPVAGVAAMAGVGSGGGDADDGLCKVKVDRGGTAGVANVTRAVVDNKCICTVVTGAKDSNGSAEDVVTALLRDRTCDGAPAAPYAEEAAAGGGGGGTVIAVVGAVAVAGGLAVALSKDSPG